MLSTRTVPRGVTPLASGTVALDGAALAWWRRLDDVLAEQAATWSATEHQFPAIISADDLNRLDYFRSFPQLATFPVGLPADESAAEEFVARCAVARPGEVPLAGHAPVTEALLPAACYPVYGRFRDQVLARPALVTVRSTCFRREQQFEPLRRQWAFTMREIVYLGDLAGVEVFLQRAQAFAGSLCERLGLPYAWAAATDPFFRPTQDGRALYQRLFPVKWEAVVDDLAIASLNRHHEHFGDACAINAGSRPAQTACLAFGLERWLAVMTSVWGDDPAQWPDPAGGPDGV